MNSEQDNFLEGWKKLLDRRTLRANLINASLYLAAWELLEDAVIKQIKQFYLLGDNDNKTLFAKYNDAVLSRHKYEFRASLLWFLEMGAIDASDLDLTDRLREHRNEIAHSLPQIAASDKEIDLDLFKSIVELVEKLDKWFILFIHVPTNPDYDHKIVDEAEVYSGRLIILHLMIKIATGEDEPE